MYRAGAIAARFLLGVIFALSAISKLSAPGIFQADVAAYHMLPDFLVGPFALALPWFEAALAAGGLLLVFTVALASNVITGNTAHGCECLQNAGLLASLPLLSWLFGGLTISLFDVARDLVLTGLAALLYLGDASALSVDALLFCERPASGGTPSATPARPVRANNRSISWGLERRR